MTGLERHDAEMTQTTLCRLSTPAPMDREPAPKLDVQNKEFWKPSCRVKYIYLSRTETSGNFGTIFVQKKITQRMDQIQPTWLKGDVGRAVKRPPPVAT